LQTKHVPVSHFKT